MKTSQTLSGKARSEYSICRENFTYSLTQKQTGIQGQLVEAASITDLVTRLNFNRKEKP